MATAAEIRAKRPAPVPVEVPGWGTVYIRKMPLAMRLSLYEWFGDGESANLTGDNILAVVCACVVDEAGSALFSDEDKEWLDADFADEVTEVFGKIGDVAGWSADALEDAEGN